MKRNTFFGTVLLLMATLGVCHGEGRDLVSERPPGTIFLDGKRLARTRALLAVDDSSPRAALVKLVQEAEKALTAGPFSVMDKTVPPPSGDKHDYASYGMYWWPNPNTRDGLPYIRRDGRTNPEGRRGDRCDTPRMSAMARAVETLALAYYFTGQPKYASRAALLLRTWFLEPETRMNPHLEYAQAIPGLVDGRGYGIIDTVSLLKVVDAAILLEDSDSWSGEDHGALKRWFGDYLHWLRTSRHGIEESRARNNHGTWYDVQVAQFALFVGDRKTAAAVLHSAKKKRVLHQVGSDGRQKLELTRTMSFHYSLYNLAGLFSLARLGEHVGVDLWRVKGKGKGKPALQAALDYVAPYADAKKKWPHQQIAKSRRNAQLIGLLRRGYQVYQKQEYLTMLGKFPKKTRFEDRSTLLYGVLPGE